MSEPERPAEWLAEWLKLRGCLYDPITRLPSLPLILDDVRRRLEGGEALGLVYLDLSGGGEAEAAAGWQGHDEAILRLADSLRARRDRLLAENDQLAVLGVRSDELVVFVTLGPGAAVVADALDSPGKQLERIYREILVIAGLALRPRLESETLSGTAPLESACLELSYEPTMRIERAIYRSIAFARDSCRAKSRRRHSGRLEELRRILAAGDIVIRFQPIVELGRGEAHGYEALSSAPTAEIFENPEVLFSFAEESEGIVELERLCRRHALGRIGPVFRNSGRGKIFLNCSVYAFGDPRLTEDLLAWIGQAGLPASEVVLEVTERTAIQEWQKFRRKLDEVRASGLQIAIDDMGSGYSSLRAVGEIQPDYLKFDRSLIHGINASAIKRDLLETLITLAGKIGARAIAEGIETEEELEVVRSLGVELGQGYLFARPAPPENQRAIHFPPKKES
jgi:EAL domain-containing protein (putative c-di-GMP-specific phosphodiesterase class I)